MALRQRDYATQQIHVSRVRSLAEIKPSWPSSDARKLRCTERLREFEALPSLQDHVGMRPGFVEDPLKLRVGTITRSRGPARAWAHRRRGTCKGPEAGSRGFPGPPPVYDVGDPSLLGVGCFPKGQKPFPLPRVGAASEMERATRWPSLLAE